VRELYGVMPPRGPLAALWSRPAASRRGKSLRQWPQRQARGRASPGWTDQECDGYPWHKDKSGRHSRQRYGNTIMFRVHQAHVAADRKTGQCHFLFFGSIVYFISFVMTQHGGAL
jgi:hypothetical protein